MADKLRDARELAFLHARCVGTGSADTGKHEFASNVARDTLNSFIGNPSLLQYAAIGLGQTREQTRVQLLERMVRPAGPPPEDEGVGSGQMMEKLERKRLKEEAVRLKLAASKEKRAKEAAVWAKK
ncbi:hypothetical protein EKO04_009760 [Ascochyta lentis]|uniref:Uncharacterized protein n=1 Tax=Ascochyta lentis TaxID=205686 RepID=A0A8H7IWZ7_9PLEO|nr:hypothetical protein EKO04_009760 [Ascochyta lentis]